MRPMYRLMLIVCPPMTNLERQRRFCDAHPGYYARRKRTERAMAKRGAEMQLAALRAAAQPADADAPPAPAAPAYESPTGC